MAYQIFGDFTILWQGDGVGPGLSLGASGQSINANTFFSGGPIGVPGGDAPTAANITTACNTMAANLATLLIAKLAQIQGWSTGGG